jgi:hypothetical protein
MDTHLCGQSKQKQSGLFIHPIGDLPGQSTKEKQQNKHVGI